MIQYARAPNTTHMITFAQNCEDVLIDRVFRKPNGFFIDVGASHPVAFSVTKHLSALGWRGINIEPDVEMWNALVADRPNDINLHCAAGRSRGHATFYRLRDRGLSTTSAVQFDSLGVQEKMGSTSVEVPLRTIDDIVAEFVTGEVDFLKIDAEGSEADVIAGVDWSTFRPRLLVIEATRPWSSDPNWQAWEPALLSNGYLVAYFDGINRYYLRTEDECLLEQFSVPVNVLDFYVTFREYSALNRVESLERELNALREARKA